MRNGRRTSSIFGSAVATCALALAQTPQPGRLDFLKSKDPSFALFANTSATTQAGKHYPDELVLITGLPSNPTISARIDLLGAPKPAGQSLSCGGLRNVVLSPDGDTALVSSDPSCINNQNTSVRQSFLFVLRNVRPFAHSANPNDLSIRSFQSKDFPQLDNVSGLAFGADGHWAVINTAGPGTLDGTNRTVRGTVVVITGLPDNPVFSAPFSVPMHSQGNIDLSLDGGTLLLNDTTDFAGVAGGGPKSDQIIVQGIRPGATPRVVGISTFVTPQGFPPGPTPVRDARLTLDGRYVLAPIPLVSQIDGQKYVGLNQIAILGPVGTGKLPIARLLKDVDGVTGGPFQAGVSPDGDSALVTNVLDNGGAELLTGLSSGDPEQFRVKALPFEFFGPPFPLGPDGPAVLASHGQVIFTPDGETALVSNWITPIVSGTAVTPSLSVLTGFHSGKIRLAANLSDPTFNPIDQRQQVATAPAGLVDYINLYLPAGADRNVLTSLVNLTTEAADKGQGAGAVGFLVNFIYEVTSRVYQGRLKRSQAATLLTLATTGMQAVIGRPENVNAAGFSLGAVAPDSIASLFGAGLAGPTLTASRPLPVALGGTTVTVFDSAGYARDAPLFMVLPTQINYLVPSGTAAGPATILVRGSGEATGAVTIDVEPVAPGLFTTSSSGDAAAVVVRVAADGSQSVEPVNGPIDLGPETDQVYLLLFGTGIRGRSGLAAVTAHIGALEAPVTFAGAQSQFDGLDQVNMRLPRSLAGLGTVEIVLSMDGVNANRVKVTIK